MNQGRRHRHTNFVIIARPVVAWRPTGIVSPFLAQHLRCHHMLTFRPRGRYFLYRATLYPATSDDPSPPP